jgi:hypothetical protein
MNYRNPKSPGYGRKYRKGEQCLGAAECKNVAGSAWGPWCYEHNVERMDRINKNMTQIEQSFAQKSVAP